MKVSMAAIPCLLLLITTIALGSDTDFSPRSYHPTNCCFNYVTYTIQRQRIKSYYETSSQCSKPGIVFITKKNYSICANPSDDWVRDYIKDLDYGTTVQD